MTDTQWHLNEFSAITMLNTRSMSNAFHNWCDQNNLTAVLNRYLEVDGTIKQPAQKAQGQSDDLDESADDNESQQ
eukprot:3962485-Amphidinium_carterae.2